MKYYSSQARTINIVRKVGYYPSMIVATKCAKALCYVINRPEFVNTLRDFLTGHHDAWQTCILKLTAAEFQVVNGFSDWYSGERHDPIDLGPDSYVMDFENVLSSYIASDLNTGHCIVFTAVRLRQFSNEEVLHPAESNDSEEL